MKVELSTMDSSLIGWEFIFTTWTEPAGRKADFTLRRMDFSTTRILQIFIPPAVEPTMPPMSIRIIRM
jgi:hypothetical protein